MGTTHQTKLKQAWRKLAQKKKPRQYNQVPTTMQLPRRGLSRLWVSLRHKTIIPVLTPKYIRLSPSQEYSGVPSSVPLLPKVPLVTSLRCFCQQTPLPRDVTHKQLVDILETKSAVVVDVRTAKELERHGTIPGAINIPLGDLETALSMRPKKLESLFNVSIDERTPLVFSCMAGIRSKQAMAIAEMLGYRNVAEYSEGWIGWAQAQQQ